MTTKGVKTFNIIINKTNGYIEKSKGNKCLPLVPSDESKDNLKTHGKLWSKIKDLIRSENNSRGDYNEVYMKIRFYSGDDLPVKTTLELYDVIMMTTNSVHKFS